MKRPCSRFSTARSRRRRAPQSKHTSQPARPALISRPGRRAIAKLAHPNVVAVHDAGTVGESIYIAMEFVDGQTVGEWLRSGKRSWREILDVFIAAGRGLAAAHAAHIIHRDFKPHNVMVTG